MLNSLVVGGLRVGRVVRVAGYVHARAHRRADPRGAAMTGGSDRWIRWTTTGCVVLLALIAGTVCCLHMHTLVELHGQAGLGSGADTVLGGRDDRDRIDYAAGRLALGPACGMLPWALLVAGSAASLAASVAVAEPTAVGRVIAAWPCGRRQHRAPEQARSSGLHAGACAAVVLRVRSAGAPGGGRLAAQRRQIARQHGRHERWGRLVKHSGAADELDISEYSEPGLRLVQPQPPPAAGGWPAAPIHGNYPSRCNWWASHRTMLGVLRPGSAARVATAYRIVTFIKHAHRDAHLPQAARCPRVKAPMRSTACRWERCYGTARYQHGSG